MKCTKCVTGGLTMTDRDRLIELFKKIEYKPFPDSATKYNLSHQFTDYALESIIDCLIANGVVLLPCKVDDTVYEIQPMQKRVQAYTIISVKYNGRSWMFSWVLKDRKGRYGNVEGFDSYQLGKTVFLSYKEAEKALKERENDG